MGVLFGSGQLGNECAVFAYRDQCPCYFLKQRATISWSDSARTVAAYTGRSRATMLGKGHGYALLLVEAKDKPAGQGRLPVKNGPNVVFSMWTPVARNSDWECSAWIKYCLWLLLLSEDSSGYTISTCVLLFPNTLGCYLCTSRVSGQRYLLSIHAQDWSSKATISVPSWSAWYLGTLKITFGC